MSGELDLEALLAGELDEAALAELERRLRADPALLRQAMESYRLRQLLPLALRGRGGDRFADAVCRSLKPASDGFVLGVERSVRRRVARQRRRSVLWLLPTAAVAALVLLAVSLRWSSPPSEPVAPSALPIAATTDDDFPVVAVAGGGLKQGETMGPGRAVALPAGASATLRWRDGTTLELAGNARLRLAHGLGKRVELERGRVDCAAAHQPEGRPLTISTPHGEATIVGTRFTLEVGATTLLRVSEGAVRLRDRAGGVDALVHGGEERRIGPPPLPYAQDFLAGLPAGWRSGELYDEPAGDWWRSVTAVAGHDQGRASWRIASEPRDHRHPCFRFDRRATIELTLAQDRPAQDQLLLTLCRADTGEPIGDLVLRIDVPDRAAWQALRVPLAKAEGLDRVGESPAVCTAWALVSFERDQHPRLARIALLPP